MSGLHFECQYVTIDVIPINTVQVRAVGRSENPGRQYYLVGIICPLVEIGLTDLPESGDAMALPGTTGLQVNTKCKLVYYVVWFFHTFPRKSAYKKANSTKTNLTFSSDD